MDETATWLLVIDKNDFHVFVVTQTETLGYTRIDWNLDSTLTFTKYNFNPLDKSYIIGHGKYNENRISYETSEYLRNYNLFHFNCRTVSFLVLVLAGFNADLLYKLFSDANILCGLDEGQCLSMKEVRSFMLYERDKQLSRNGFCYFCIC